MLIFKHHQVIDYIKPYLPYNPLIVEAGAFNGNDTIRLAQQWPEGHIYAFEPVPYLYEQLLHNSKPYPNIHCHQLALSNHNGIAPFYVAEKQKHPGRPSQAGSLLPPKEKVHPFMVFPSIIKVPTATLESWAYSHAITHVDCVWLDTQGYELAILQSAGTLLKNITVIYSEVSFIERYKGQPSYQTVKAWLESHGFTEIGRDFTNTTDSLFGNVLYVRHDQ